MFREKSLDFHERFVCFRYLKRMPYVHNERPSLKDDVRTVCGGFGAGAEVELVDDLRVVHVVSLVIRQSMVVQDCSETRGLARISHRLS